MKGIDIMGYGYEIIIMYTINGQDKRHTLIGSTDTSKELLQERYQMWLENKDYKGESPKSAGKKTIYNEGVDIGYAVYKRHEVSKNSYYGSY